MRTHLIIITILLLILLCSTSPTVANPSNTSESINSFVESLYPKGSHFFWVINDTTTESEKEMVVDINTMLHGAANEGANQHRFLLLLIDGELLAAQKIPLGAKVDCKQEQEV